MKKLVIANLIIAAVLAISCKKQDIKGDSSVLGTGAYLRLQQTIRNTIDYAARTTSSASIKVGGIGAAIDNVNIYVVAGSDLDKNNWKKVKNVPFTEGVTLEVKATEMAAALGISVDNLVPGSSYTFYNEAITKDGRAFSLANTTTDFESQAPYQMALQWQVFVVCPFDATASAGTYHVIDDSNWNDFVPGDPITVTAGPGANQISMIAYPSPAFGSNRKPTVIDVDPATGTATIKSQVFGDYPGAPNSIIQGAGFVFSCTGVISLSNDLTVGGDNFLAQKFIIAK
jgi:hypothetical protein